MLQQDTGSSLKLQRVDVGSPDMPFEHIESFPAPVNGVGLCGEDCGPWLEVR